MKTSICQKGFSAVETVLVLVVVALLGVIGYTVYAHGHSGGSSASTPVQLQPTAAQQNASVYAGWKTYTLANEKLTFKYPSSWQLKDYAGDPGTRAGNDAVDLTGTDSIGGDVFGMNVYVGLFDFTLPSGGLHVINAAPVMFAGKQGYLVAYNGELNGQVLDTELTTVPDHMTFFHASAVSADPDAVVRIGMRFGDVQPHDWQQVQASKDYQDAKLVVESMTY